MFERVQPSGDGRGGPRPATPVRQPVLDRVSWRLGRGAIDAITTRPVARLLGGERQPQLLLDRSREEAVHAVRLPARGGLSGAGR